MDRRTGRKPAMTRLGTVGVGGALAVGLIAELSPRTFWTFTREFSPFNAVRRGWTAALHPDTVRPVSSGDRAV